MSNTSPNVVEPGVGIVSNGKFTTAGRAATWIPQDPAATAGAERSVDIMMKKNDVRRTCFPGLELRMNLCNGANA